MYIDTVLMYIELPREVLKEAERLEAALFDEFKNTVIQSLSKFTDVTEFKYYNVVDRQRVRNMAIVMTIISKNIGVVLEIDKSERHIYKRACEENALLTPCREI